MFSKMLLCLIETHGLFITAFFIVFATYGVFNMQMVGHYITVQNYVFDCFFEHERKYKMCISLIAFIFVFPNHQSVSLWVGAML